MNRRQELIRDLSLVAARRRGVFRPVAALSDLALPLGRPGAGPSRARGLRRVDVLPQVVGAALKALQRRCGGPLHPCHGVEAFKAAAEAFRRKATLNDSRTPSLT